MDSRRALALATPWALLFSAALAGCTPASTAPAGDTSAESGTANVAEPADPVVARVGDSEIRLSELEEHAADELAEVEQRRYQVLLGALTNLVRQRTLDEAAREQGMTVAELVQAEVDAKVEPVSPDAVDALMAEGPYQQELARRQALAEGDEAKAAAAAEFRSLVQARLEQDRRGERIQAFLAELKSAHPVKMSFAPPAGTRKDVSVEGAPIRGDENAPVTIVEFSDFECPFCGRAQDTIHELLELYPGKVRLAYRHMPLAMHPHAPKAAEAAECAREHDRFWEYHDALYANQRALDVDQLVQHAVDLGLDGVAFRECVESGRMATRVREDMERASKLGVSSTPMFFVNGLIVKGAQPLEAFQAVIEPELELAG